LRQYYRLLLRYPRLLGGDLGCGRTEQVSQHLPADRRVRIQQPLDDRLR
jgi:hypothetical protein